MLGPIFLPYPNPLESSLGKPQRPTDTWKPTLHCPTDCLFASRNRFSDPMTNFVLLDSGNTHLYFSPDLSLPEGLKKVGDGEAIREGIVNLLS